jgi:hypothetical protein
MALIYTPAFIVGTTAEDDPTVYAALTNTGKFNITINSTAIVCNPNFTGVSTMAAVATAIQVALRTIVSTVTVTWSASLVSFTINTGNTTYTSAITVASTPSTGTDISAMIGMDDGTITVVTADSGYTVLDLYNAVRDDIFHDTNDTTMGPDTFRRYLNEAYRETISRVLKYFPNYYMEQTPVFDIITTQNTYALPADCLTVLRVGFPNPFDDSNFPREVVIPETNFDERIRKTGLRWYRDVSTIMFRGLTDFGQDIEDAVIYYRKRVPTLIADTDRPQLPSNDWDIILLPYVKFLWYKEQHMEIDANDYFSMFNDRLQEMVKDVKPTDQPIALKIKGDDGIPTFNYLI